MGRALVGDWKRAMREGGKAGMDFGVEFKGEEGRDVYKHMERYMRKGYPFVHGDDWRLFGSLAQGQESNQCSELRWDVELDTCIEYPKPVYEDFMLGGFLHEVNH